MKNFLRLWVQIHFVATILAMPLAAQQQEPYRESVEVRVINVDVYVEDADGNAVRGLTAEDFVILEDGDPQPITNFAEYRSGTFVEAPENVPETTADIRAQLPRQPRTIVFLVDAFNQTPGERKELFGRIRAFMRDGLEQGDRAALFNWRNSMTTVVPLTEDLEQIDRALSTMGGLQLPAEDQSLDQVVQFVEESERFRASAGGSGAGLSADTSGGSSLAAEMETTIRNCAEEYLSEMENKSASIRRMIDTLSGLEGKKIMVYVAGRFPADTATFCQSILRTPQLGPASFTFRAGTFSTDRLVDQITDTANAAGITFYPIRPHTSSRRVTKVEYYDESALGASEELGDTLVTMNDADALATLAEQTGGRLAVGDHMIDDLLPEIISDLDNYYSIGYRATSDGSDRERKIRVRMKNRDLRARTRTAFIEKSRLTEVKDRLVGNLVGEPIPGDIDLEVVVGTPAPDRRGRSILPVEVRIPLDQLTYAGPSPVSEVRLLSAAGTTPGAITEISETVKRIEQPPSDLSSSYITWQVDLVMAEGGTKVSFGVLDERSGLAGFATVDRTDAALARREEEALENLDEWRRALTRGHFTGKPLLVYFRPDPCYRRSGFNRIHICEDFENDLLAHPEIAQRLERFEVIRRAPDGEIAGWPKGSPGLALMRIDGESIVRWPKLPDGANLVRVLSTIAPHAAELVRINELIRAGRTDEGDYSTAMLQIRFGLRREAAAILERLVETGSEMATVALAYLEAGENRSRGLSRLRSLTSTTTDPAAVGEAWLAIAAFTTGEERTAALEAASAVAPEGSSQKTIAHNELQKLQAPSQDVSVIRIAPVSIATGRTELRTMVRSSHVASVEFILDGQSIMNDTSAPFRAIVDFERLPTRHEMRVVARDPEGSILGEDALTLNGQTDSLWVRFVAPESDVVSGEANVELVLQIPEGESIGRVEIDHDGTVYEVDGPPYRAAIPVPPDRISVLTARVVLPDGRTAEDIRILNARGLAETAAVHLVELPLVPVGDEPLRADQIRVVESGESRKVEALIGADAAPLTLGMVIDVSGSMFERILDLQASAASLVGRVLRAEDRGFLVSFDSEARLEVGVTSDHDRLVREIRSLSPIGSTALFDGMMLGLLQFEPLGGRRALIVFSDGDDRASRYKLEDVAEVAKRSAVPIYLVRLLSEEEQRRTLPSTITPSFGLSSSTVLDRQQQARLEHLTRESGGGFFQLDSLDAIEAVFAEIGQMVRRQMLLTYLTETSRNDQWRNVEVQVEGKGAVRAPQGYYAKPH